MSIHLRPMIAIVALAAVGTALAQNPPAESAKAGQNIYLAGGEVRPGAPIGGDLAAAGGHVIVDQPVAGDAALAGGSVEVLAPIGDDLRAAGGHVKVNSAVAGELVAVGANLQLGPAAVVSRGARLRGSSVTMEGRVTGPLDARGQNILINGEVQGDATLAGASVQLGPKARISGTLRYAAAGELAKAEGATVAGAITRDDRLTVREDRRHLGHGGWRMHAGGGWAPGVFTYFAVLVCSALFVLLVPRYSERAAARLRSAPWVSLGIGLATLIGVPLAVVLLCITLLGIPLGLALLALYPVLLLAGFIVGVSFLARSSPPALRQQLPASFGGRLGWFALALLVVMLLARVPFVGPLLVGVVALTGLGAGVLEVFARRRDPGSPGAPADVSVRTPTGGTSGSPA